jgi:hypothetical protein
MVTSVTRPVLLVEQELLDLPEFTPCHKRNTTGVTSGAATA